MKITASHIYPLLSPDSLNTCVDNVIAALQGHKDNFSVIAFRGMSGALVASAVAAKMNKYLLLVRKDEQRYSHYQVEGPTGEYNYVIIDDVVCTGNTIRTIKRSVEQFNGNAKFIGVYLHQSGYFTTSYN